MSQGVIAAEKPKSRGRGRGMVRKTSQESSGSTEEPPGPPQSSKVEETTTPSSAEKTRETKVRRTKAGYEPYQVKKKLSISLSDSKTSPSTKGSPSKNTSDTRNKKSSDDTKKHSQRSQHSRDSHKSKEGHSKDSTDNKDTHDKESHKDSHRKKSHHNKPRYKKDSKRTENKGETESPSIKNESNEPANEGANKKEADVVEKVKAAMSLADEQNLRQKTLGLSILECPCMLSNGCSGCSPHASKENSPVTKATDSGNCKTVQDSLTVEVSDPAKETEAVIDNKFLVASPRLIHKEKSMLDSDNDEQETTTNTELDKCFATDNIQGKKGVGMTHAEINAMFTNVLEKDGDTISTTSGNSQVLVSEEEFVSRSNSVTTASSCSNTGSNLKVADESEDKKHKETEPQYQQPIKQRNMLSSIQSILNENKLLDSQTKLKTNQNLQKDKNNSRKSSKTRSDGRKTQNKEEKPKRAKDQTKTSNANSGRGLLTLPADYRAEESHNADQEEQHTGRHVHFDVKEKRKSPTAKVSKDELVKRNLQVIENKQKEMKSLLQKAFQDPEVINEITRVSEVIQQQYGELIVFYQEYAFRHDFESVLWKSAFHNIISKFRELLENKSTTKDILQEVGALYWKFLQNGIQFLDELVVHLQDNSNFSLDEYLEDPIRMNRCGKQVKLALRSCHLLLIYIGDLERYVAFLQQDSSYSQAQNCYKQAQMLAPKNGKSYNQLAVVAVLTKRKLDAVYYYARSLLASNPIMTAKDRLTSIFYEIQRKALVFQQRYQTQQQQQQQHEETVLKERAEKLNPHHLRDEIWIFIRHNQMYKVMLTSDGELVYLTPPPKPTAHSTHNHHPTLKNTKSNPKQDKLSLSKINRGFTIYFLFVHCKLYTNIGLEGFMSVHQDTLSYFKTLLQYPKASSIKEENILKYMAINIFSINLLVDRNGGFIDVVANTGLDFALVFGMDMYGVLCTHCSKLLTSHGLGSLDRFLPAVRVWLLWMVDNCGLVAKSSASSMMDIWTDLCFFFNLVMEIEFLDPVQDEDEANTNVYLNEDVFLAGFKPYSSKFVHSSTKKENEDEVCRRLRVTSLKEIINKLDELGTLPFAYDEKEKTYKAVRATEIFTSPVKQKQEFDEDDDDFEASEDVMIEDSDDEEIDGHDSESSHLDELKAQKADLARLIQENEEKRQKAMAILETHKSEGRHISENSPSYIVLDTNCFIDCPQHIATILDSKDFNVIVPLIVINELDGLKKGAVDQSRLSRHRNVTECARLAIDFLEDRFSVHDPNIRAITSIGNELSTIAFRDEELSNDRGTNDDVILSCCLKYCKEHISYEGASKIVHRDVVLLTNDRNLRLKAHSRFVPTVPLLTFMKMAQFEK